MLNVDKFLHLFPEGATFSNLEIDQETSDDDDDRPEQDSLKPVSPRNIKCLTRFGWIFLLYSASEQYGFTELAPRPIQSISCNVRLWMCRPLCGQPKLRGHGHGKRVFCKICKNMNLHRTYFSSSKHFLIGFGTGPPIRKY